MTERRRCENWLKSFGKVVSGTESPDHYWMWSGIHTLCAALERRVWLEYGLDPVYPNMYVVLVSPPGRCRKGPPISLSKRMLKAVGARVSTDSGSKQQLVNEIATSFRQITIPQVGQVQQSPMAVVSKEFSSLLAIDPKTMIEFLTDIYDSHEMWEYKVLSRDPEQIYGPCVSLFAATTPSYLANNVPYEAFGAGFFSRVVFVVGMNKRKRVPRPELSEEKEMLIEDLVYDLKQIRKLAGPIEWTEEAGELFDQWYMTLDEKYRTLKDERFWGFIERAHIQVLKVAMAITVARGDELVFTPDAIGQAIDMIEDIFCDLPKAFGSLGRSELAQDTHDIIWQLQQTKGWITFSQLISDNWQNMSPSTLKQVLETLEAKGALVRRFGANGKEEIKWMEKEAQ